MEILAVMESPLTQYRTGRKLQQKDLAGELGIRPPTLWKWENWRVPAGRVLEVEKKTGISRYELRPDVFGKAPRAAK